MADLRPAAWDTGEKYSDERVGGDDISFPRDQKLVEGLGLGILPPGFPFLVPDYGREG